MHLGNVPTWCISLRSCTLLLMDPVETTSRVEIERLRAEVASLKAERQRLVETLLLAERDRQLLGYELHDGIVQDLTAAAMILEGATHPASGLTDEQRTNVERAMSLIRGGLLEVRRLIGGLAAVELADLSLGDSLEQLVARYRERNGLNATYEGDSQRLGLAPATRYLLLRIAQEALNNVWKHAPSSQARVSLHERGGRLEMAIEDNGPGFDVSHGKPGHFGLDGMRARAHLLGAELTIDSAAGQGTRILVRQPPAR